MLFGVYGLKKSEGVANVQLEKVDKGEGVLAHDELLRLLTTSA